MDGWVDGWMDGWMDGMMDGWMDGYYYRWAGHVTRMGERRGIYRDLVGKSEEKETTW